MTDNILAFKPRPYRTPQSTIDAFWYLVQLNDTARLKAWLRTARLMARRCSSFGEPKMAKPDVDRVFHELGSRTTGAKAHERQHDPN